MEDSSTTKFGKERFVPVRQCVILFIGIVLIIRFPAVADSARCGQYQPVPAFQMIIVAETAGPDTGTIRFALFDCTRAKCWDDRVIMAADLPVAGRRTEWKTAPLPEGLYALAVFHDLNGNDKLDKSFIGKPVEPYGFSNDARHLMGPPSIREAAFRFESAFRTVVVKLH